MTAHESVIRELDAMHQLGMIDKDTFRRATAFVERSKSEVANWLDSAMSVSDVADMIVAMCGSAP